MPAPQNGAWKNKENIDKCSEMVKVKYSKTKEVIYKGLDDHFIKDLIGIVYGYCDDIIEVIEEVCEG